jgi:hypothetical protein
MARNSRTSHFLIVPHGTMVHVYPYYQGTRVPWYYVYVTTHHSTHVLTTPTGFPVAPECLYFRVQISVGTLS